MSPESSANKLTLYSDGGSRQGEGAAGACIIELPDAEPREVKLVAYLDSATNNEAEIFAGLLGFSYLRAVSREPGSVVHWIADSEYLLKSATAYINNWQRNGWKTASKKPVKNQGLWRAYLHLSKGFEITPEHVYGHTGHEENEACDSACNWVRDNLIDGHEPDEFEMYSVDIADGLSGGGEWLLIDGRSMIAALREVHPDLDVVDSFVESMS